MAFPLLQVDAFTAEPFGGNPAAVCLLPGPAEPAWMQRVAREMNLSETAFIHPDDDHFSLRWFTPAAEVDLCGHATLASAHVLWQIRALPPERPACFMTRSGLLTARRIGDWIEMDFPAKPPEPCPSPAGLLEALGTEVRFVARNVFDYLVEVPDEAALRAMKPDVGKLRALPVRGVIVTAAASMSGMDFVSRFFAPAVGVDEDPVTGSAHCCLGPFWGKRLGKTELVGYQASTRGGVVKVGLQGERVLLRGQAVTVLRGELLA